MKPKRPVRKIPIVVKSLDAGLADSQGFKHYLIVIGDGGLRPVIRMHVDTSKTGGAEQIRFVVKHE